MLQLSNFLKEEQNSSKMQLTSLLAASAIILCLQLLVVDSVIITDETRLHRDLFSDKKQVLPLNNNNERKVKVIIGLTLNQVVDVEEANEHVIINAVIRQKWRNPDVAWNPIHYGNVTLINVKPNQTWTPDLFLYANVEEDKSYNGMLDTLKTRVKISSTGDVEWNSPVMFRISCGINVAKFPFDTQKCEFKFSSFTHDDTKLELSPESDEANTQTYTENVEWKFISMYSRKQQSKHTSFESQFDEVIFNLIIKRKPLFLMINLIAPNMIFSFLTIAVYTIPSASNERSSFVVSLVLAMALFLTSSIDLMPDSSEVIPLFSYFLGLVLFAMFLLTITVCYNLSIYYANANVSVMPFWMRKYILNKLAPFFGIIVKSPRRKDKSKPLDENVTMDVNEELECCHPGRLWKPDAITKTAPNLWRARSTKSNALKEMGLDSKANRRDLKKISRYLSSIIDSFEKEEEKAHRQAEWHVVSKTLDKLCLWIFVCVFLLILTICSIKGASLT